jgi:hypothetical protein
MTGDLNSRYLCINAREKIYQKNWKYMTGLLNRKHMKMNTIF